MSKRSVAQRRVRAKKDSTGRRANSSPIGGPARQRTPKTKAAPTGIETFTAYELQKMEFPPIRFAVNGYVAEGLTLFAGKPKIGNLYFTTRLRRLDEGGIEDLEQWILEHEPGLVILDTLAHVKPLTKREAGGYEADYLALSPLQRMAGELGVCIIVVHHLRKMMGDDPLDMISGTTGLTGAVDNILVLSRDTHGVTLYGRGRDIEEIEVAVEMVQGTWRLLGTASEVRRSEERQAILDLIAEAGKPLGPKDIADRLKRPANNIRQLLFQMAKAGELSKSARGRYGLPAE